MFLVKLYRAYRKRAAKKEFCRNAILGERANIQHTAHCMSQGGRDRIVIGEHCEIKGGIYCYRNGRIQIGKHFYCGGFTYIHAAQSIAIGDCVILSNYVRIMDNNSHPHRSRKEVGYVSGRSRAGGRISLAFVGLFSFGYGRHNH